MSCVLAKADSSNNYVFMKLDTQLHTLTSYLTLASSPDFTGVKVAEDCTSLMTSDGKVHTVADPLVERSVAGSIQAHSADLMYLVASSKLLRFSASTNAYE